MSRQSRFDFLIVGSGFSGSLLASVLASQGKSVLLIDRSQHPRFAIGESSTPTADFLLAYLAERWQLPKLAPLACWGLWKQRYPEIVCGKKRGFSYYRHHPGHPIDRERLAIDSMLVAASAEDAWSDTHWLRSSVDHFLAQQAVTSGVVLQESMQLVAADFDRTEHRWTVRMKSAQPSSDHPSSDHPSPEEAEQQVHASWLIDATGHHPSLARMLGCEDDSEWMRTRTGAIYGHFESVSPFDEARSELDPFSGDDAAQHHVLDQGWFWMLRFDNGVTSVGLVQPTGSPRSEQHFWDTIARHPSIDRLMRQARLVAPSSVGNGNGACLGATPRMSRCRSRAYGDGWVSLPVSVGFIDPLHSSGIAHALSGVVRLAEIFGGDSAKYYPALQEYEREVRGELEWLDLLVSGCYTGQPSFRKFIAFACFYFMSAIGFEKQLSADPGRWPLGFMQWRDTGLVDQASEAYRRLTGSDRNASDEDAFVESIRAGIEPWNRVGLLDPSNRNRIPHAAAPKYASGILRLALRVV